jgi:DNA-binding transcriptional LysR family regulator
MELRVLEYFVAIADTGSITAAAARCHVAQPSITQRLKGLELELGEELFLRGPRGVVLTEAGRALEPSARAAVSAVAGAKQEFSRRKGLLAGTLRIGVVEGLEESMVPGALGRFHRTHPAIDIELNGGTSPTLIDAVAAGRIDVAIIARPTGLPELLETLPLLSDELVAVLPESSALGVTGRVRLADLAEEPVISYGTTSGLRTALDDAARSAGVTVHVGFATNDVSFQVALVREGLGIALAAGSDPAVQHGEGLRVVGLAPPVTYEKVLAWRRSAVPNPVLEALLHTWTGEG